MIQFSTTEILLSKIIESSQHGPVFYKDRLHRYSLDLEFGWVMVEARWNDEWRLKASYPIHSWKRFQKQLKEMADESGSSR